MHQHTLSRADADPTIGHNHPPVAIDVATSLKRRLDTIYQDLVARFADLELGCTRIPNPIYSEEEARLVTDFIAQCQVHMREAESTHKAEKATFLHGGRTVDAFFKRRCDRLNEALLPVFARLKDYRDQVTAAAGERHHTLLRTAEADAKQATELRAEVEQLSQSKSLEDRRRAAEQLVLADALAERAQALMREAAACLEPLRIEGEYGAVAYVAHIWSFEVTDPRKVPRRYLSLNAEMVRAAITKDGVRDIPGLSIFQTENLRVRGAA